MTTMRRIRTLATAALAASALACATQTLSKNEAAAFADLSVKDFLNQRFGEASTGQGALSSMTAGMENFRAKFSSDEEKALIKQQQARRERVRGDGSFMYTALYDGNQQVQLMRPMTELREFCVSKGGQFQVSKPVDPEHVERIFASRTNQIVREGAQADANFNTLTNSNQNAQTLDAAMTSAHLDRLEDRAGASKGFRLAAQKRAFGEGTCTHPSRADANWTVAVQPVYFEPYNPQSSVKLHEIDLRLATATP